MKYICWSNTRWFKYDRECNRLVYTQNSPGHISTTLYIKSVLWRVAKCLSYIEEARCLKIKESLVFYLEAHVRIFMQILRKDCYFPLLCELGRVISRFFSVNLKVISQGNLQGRFLQVTRSAKTCRLTNTTPSSGLLFIIYFWQFILLFQQV